MNEDDDITLPSIRDQLINLERGETFTKSVQVHPTNLHKLHEYKVKFRQNYSAPIKRAKDKMDYDYTLETTEAITQSGGIYVIMIITRVK